MVAVTSKASNGNQKPQLRRGALWIEKRLHLDTRHPEPLKDLNAFWRGATQASTILMATLAFGVFLFFARALLLPVLCAIAIAMTLGPIIAYLSKRGVPSWLTALAVIVLMIAGLNAFWRGATQAATILMAVLAFGVFLFFARALLLPVLCAIAIAMTLGPIIAYLSKRGVPSWLTALAVIVLMIAGLNIAIVALAKPVSDITGRLPELANAVREKLHILDRPLAALSEMQISLGLGQTDAKVDPSRMIEGAVTGIVTVVTPAAVQFVLQLILFFGTLFFAIVGRNAFRNYVVSWFAMRDARLRTLKILNDIEENLSGYLIVVSAINLALGIFATFMAWGLGLPSPLLWGALAFALNYIPYIGPGIVYGLLFLAGLIVYPTLLGALLPPGIYMAVTLVEGQFLTPMIIGRSVLSVHPLAVFLGIAFWAWLWGPIGAFLAMPLLIVGRVALDHLYPRQQTELPG